jgi:hypothetical protein
MRNGHILSLQELLKRLPFLLVYQLICAIPKEFERGMIGALNKEDVKESQAACRVIPGQGFFQWCQ